MKEDSFPCTNSIRGNRWSQSGGRACVTAEEPHSGAISIVVIVGDEDRASALRSALTMVFPRALVTAVD